VALILAIMEKWWASFLKAEKAFLKGSFSYLVGLFGVLSSSF
jgi:hypothetical protein